MNSLLKSRWYREPWVWLLIGLPATAVIGGFITLYLAIISNDGLVVDDYYKQGLEINRILARDKAAATHQLMATVTLDQQQEAVVVNLLADPNCALPGQITLIHEPVLIKPAF